jgi:hypothetical protein
VHECARERAREKSEHREHGETDVGVAVCVCVCVCVCVGARARVCVCVCNSVLIECVGVPSAQSGGDHARCSTLAQSHPRPRACRSLVRLTGELARSRRWLWCTPKQPVAVAAAVVMNRTHSRRTTSRSDSLSDAHACSSTPQAPCKACLASETVITVSEFGIASTECMLSQAPQHATQNGKTRHASTSGTWTAS